MIKDLKNFLHESTRSAKFKTVSKNFGFLSIIQLANYALPLVTLPYLTVVLGTEAFGHVMFAQAFAQYFVIVVDYGFNFSATGAISVNREDSRKVSEIFSSVMVLKLLLLLLSLGVMLGLVFTVDIFSDHRMVYIASFGIVVGNALFPTWLFQGLEKMKYITFVSVSSKVLYTIFVFLLIKSPDHFVKVPMIASAASILPSICALLYIPRIYPIKVIVPNVGTLKEHMRGGWAIFLSAASTSLYSVSNTFLIGILINHTYAGYFSFAEKVVRACTSLFGPLNQALFPYMSLKMRQAPREGLKIFTRVFWIFSAIAFIGAVILFFGSDLLVYIIEPAFYPSIQLIKLLSPLLLLVAISNLIGFQIVLTTGRETTYLLTVFIAGILSIGFCVLLAEPLSYRAPAVALLIAETFICISFFRYFRRAMAETR